MSDREILAAIGLRIREARKAAKLRQDELGGLAFVSVASVGSWEMGRTSPTALNLIRIAAALEVTACWLLGESESAVARD